MKAVKITLILFLALIISACGGEQQSSHSSAGPAGELSDFELEHGIGPVTERLQIADQIDTQMVERGASIYRMNCEACHALDSRMVGPALGSITEERSAEFIMNFILNPSGMIERHPEGQRLLREYRTPMPFQNLSMQDARAIVEYLRDYASES